MNVRGACQLPLVVGHRGLGANTLGNDVMKHSPGEEIAKHHRRWCCQCEGEERGARGGGVQYRENSLRGCLAESTFVEVDCQRSKDGVVCLWHDDEVLLRRSSQGGEDDHEEDSHHAEEEKNDDEEEEGEDKMTSFRVRDITSARLAEAATDERLMRRYKRKSSDNAGTGDLVQWTDPAKSSLLIQKQEQQQQDRLPGNDDTLRRLLRDPDPRMGVNIEMKLVADGEVGDTSDHDMQKEQEELEIEIRLLVSAIHEEVRQYACECNDDAKARGLSSSRCRPIVYSSFSPECCIRMSETLRATENASMGCGGCVHFLTDGKPHHLDARRRSFGAAVLFVNHHGLCGIVCEASVLLAEERQRPGAVADAARTMSIATYGKANNDEKLVMHQVALGVRCIITDFPHELRRVLALSQPNAQE